MLLTTLLLPLAVSAAVINQQSPNVANVVVEKLEPRYRKTANRARYKLGPYTLNGSKGGSGFGDSTMQGQSIRYSMPKTLCNSNGPCTVLAGQVGIVFADGKQATPATGIYIHHILTSDSTKKQTPWLSNCGSPTRPAVNIAGLLGGTAFVGTGEDSAEGGQVYTSEDGTRNSGYHVGANDVFTGWAQVVNYNKENKQVYIFYDLEWVPGIVGEDTKVATFTATCGGSPMIKLGNGPTRTTSGDFYFMEDGKVLGGRGHLHDGGVKMLLYINNKNVCSSDAIYGVRTDEVAMGGHSHGGSSNTPAAPSPAIKTISGMTTCSGPFPVKKGDTLKLVAEYDLSKHPLRTSASGGKASDVMGMMGVTFTANK